MFVFKPSVLPVRLICYCCYYLIYYVYAVGADGGGGGGDTLVAMQVIGENISDEFYFRLVSRVLRGPLQVAM